MTPRPIFSKDTPYLLRLFHTLRASMQLAHHITATAQTKDGKPVKGKWTTDMEFDDGSKWQINVRRIRAPKEGSEQ